MHACTLSKIRMGKPKRICELRKWIIRSMPIRSNLTSRKTQTGHVITYEQGKMMRNVCVCARVFVGKRMIQLVMKLRKSVKMFRFLGRACVCVCVLAIGKKQWMNGFLIIFTHFICETKSFLLSSREERVKSSCEMENYAQRIQRRFSIIVWNKMMRSL